MDGWRIGIVTATGLMLMACRQTPSNESTQAAEQPPTIEASNIEHSNESAPVVLKLESTQLDRGRVSLLAHIDATSAFTIPVNLSVELPEGAKLVEGTQRETLQGLEAGRSTRAFVIELPEGVGSVKVVLDGKQPEGAFGFHAEKMYPELPKRQFIRGATPPSARPPIAPKAARSATGGAQ